MWLCRLRKKKKEGDHKESNSKFHLPNRILVYPGAWLFEALSVVFGDNRSQLLSLGRLYVYVFGGPGALAGFLTVRVSGNEPSTSSRFLE